MTAFFLAFQSDHPRIHAAGSKTYRLGIQRSAQPVPEMNGCLHLLAPDQQRALWDTL